VTHYGQPATPTEVPLEATDADAVEQQTPVVPDEDLEDEDSVVEIDLAVEADPADVLEQAEPVPLDEERTDE